MSEAGPEEVLLFIADISGYTSFMRRNQEALVHSHTVIRQLIEGLLARIVPPLEVSKLEGDAVFFWARRPADESERAALARLAGDSLVAMLEGFPGHVTRLAQSRYCDCDACRGIEDLRLKIVGHSGRAVIGAIGRFHELAGVDVILAHRLLKNRVPADEYLLLTQAALLHVAVPACYACSDGRELCEGLGEVSVRAFVPAREPPEERRRRYQASGLTRKLLHKADWTCRILRDEIGVRSGLLRRPPYRNLPPVDPPGAREALIALAMFLLLPLLLPTILVQNLADVIATHYRGPEGVGQGRENG